jgi:hypothetical protein
MALKTYWNKSKMLVQQSKIISKQQKVFFNKPKKTN